ncbi:class I SAM-dependent methyltransferase [Streptomyces sp. A7024]|uniref:Class I SAM-dependent methyltransferase n=1 Tax=Streptomyces coryli TaxID=1128680 RepID=A0A6G4TX12_9ACTN|nr:class I SAM-dependent methyltransferase [Streptomyces coryli]NGN64515.1 class I SAM-dependent methyltransferase [Streptomyces coryli]
MPTPAQNEPPEVHELREAAESFGIDAERYDRTRPTYPAALIERIAATAPGPDVLDVGSGTGIAARQLRAAGCRVLGVEPDARMAELARRTGTETEVATIETWDPAGRTFDAVVAGQAWHWVDAHAGAVKAAQALRPGGGLLAVFWNVAETPPEANTAFAEAYRRAVPELPLDRGTQSALAAYEPMFAKAAEGIRAAAGSFTAPQEWRYTWEHTYTRDAWLDQLPTGGVFTRLPRPTLDALLAEVAAVIDGLGGHLPVSYTTVAVTAVRA